MEYFVRTTENEVRGPYSFDVAESLFKHGKIEPYWELSADKLTWKVVEKVFGNQAKTSPSSDSSEKAWGMPTATFCLLMHLSPFIPGVGLIIFIAMWVTNSGNQTVTRHGKIIVNWLISVFIYSICLFVLLFIPLIGLLDFVLFPALGICSLIFSIIGAVKAGHGIAWRYPLALNLVR